jgi:hypothetical protein
MSFVLTNSVAKKEVMLPFQKAKAKAGRGLLVLHVSSFAPGVTRRLHALGVRSLAKSVSEVYSPHPFGIAY